MTSLLRSSHAIVLAILVAASGAFGYDAPLSDEAVREAYFLGQHRDETTAHFLETYRRYFPIPKSGPHIYAVELFTPYALVVEGASKQVTNYSAQQAEQDYRLRGDFVRVAVYVRFTSTYSSRTDWRAFQISLKQSGKTLEPGNVRYEGTRVVFPAGKGGSNSRLTGFIVWLEYEISNLASEEATAEIDSPDGQQVLASFDLSRLR